MELRYCSYWLGEILVLIFGGRQGCGGVRSLFVQDFLVLGSYTFIATILHMHTHTHEIGFCDDLPKSHQDLRTHSKHTATKTCICKHDSCNVASKKRYEFCLERIRTHPLADQMIITTPLVGALAAGMTAQTNFNKRQAK